MGAHGKLRLAADLAAAASIDDLTRRLYDGVVAVFDSVVIGFDLLDPETHRPQSTSGHGVSRFFLAKYDQVARETDPVLQRAIATQRLAYNLDMMSESEWRSLGVYREVFSLHRMLSIAYAPVVVDGRVVATINLGRPEGAAGFSREELRDATDLAGLVAGLMASLEDRRVLERERGLFREALDLVSEPVVISDVRTAARHLNMAAHRVLDERPGDAVGIDEALIAVHDGVRGARGGTGLVERSFVIDDGGALVSLLDSARSRDGLPEWFHRNLTAREAQVALLVARGLRDAEIAAALQLSVHTVKGYLRDIFKRTGVRSRVELTRIAARQGTPAEGAGQVPR